METASTISTYLSSQSFSDSDDDHRSTYADAQQIWDEVRCSRFHKLTYSASLGGGWACDMWETDWPRALYDDDHKKTQYGLKPSEPWQCLSGCTGFRALDGVAAYSCRECDFDICFRCHERARLGLARMKAVTQALNTENKVEWLQSKLMVVGEGRAGKTSTVRTLVGEEMVKGLASTVGADLRHARVKEKQSWHVLSEEERKGHALNAAVKQLKERGEDIQFQPQILAQDQQEFGSFGGEDGGSIEKEGEVEVEVWAKGREGSARRRRSSVEEEEKTEEEDGEEEEERGGEEGGVEEKVEVAEVAGEFNLDLMNQSLEDMKSVKFTIWDFGGQRVFYSLHHLFLTRYGVYLVVFDLKKHKKKPAESFDFLQFWLQSIRLHAKKAPVILVGTHVDLLRGGAKEVARIDKELRPFLAPYEQIHQNKPAGLTLFPLSNKTTEGIDAVRAQIERVSKQQDFLHMQISIRWLRTLDTLTADHKRSWVSLTEVHEIAKQKCGISLIDEVGVMLKLFHELGVLIHFTSTTALEKVVITNPQFVIDQLGKVIRDPELHKLNMSEIRNAGLTTEVKNLQKDAIASYDLLQFFWGRGFTPFFIDLMRRTLLMSDWPFDNDSDRHFLIPSLLRKRKMPVETAGHTCVFRFGKGELPDGCFSRVVCLCLEYSTRQSGKVAPLIGKHFARMATGGNDATITLSQADSEIVLVSSPASDATNDAFIVARMIQKVNEDVMGSGLRWEALYQDPETNKMLNAQQAKKQRLAPWFDDEEGAEKLAAPQEPQRQVNLEAFIGALL